MGLIYHLLVLSYIVCLIPQTNLRYESLNNTIATFYIISFGTFRNWYPEKHVLIDKATESISIIMILIYFFIYGIPTYRYDRLIVGLILSFITTILYGYIQSELWFITAILGICFISHSHI
jgi:hypothetical protein